MSEQEIAVTLRQLVQAITPLIDQAQAQGLAVSVRIALPRDKDGTRPVLSYGDDITSADS